MGWTIERVIPGEAPVALPFRGNKMKAKAEIRRLILAERTPDTSLWNPSSPKPTLNTV